MDIIGIIITLFVYGLIFWLLWWLVGFMGIPEPFKKIAIAILALGAVVICISLLLSLTGQHSYVPLIRMR